MDPEGINFYTNRDTTELSDHRVRIARLSSLLIIKLCIKGAGVKHIFGLALPRSETLPVCVVQLHYGWGYFRLGVYLILCLLRTDRWASTCLATSPGKLSQRFTEGRAR